MMCDFVEMGFIPVRKWRPGRVVEGTSLLRKHMGLNLYREFESLRLRQFVCIYAAYTGIPAPNHLLSSLVIA